ncbi:MAG: CvpA family protein [Halofilum sp. (in: g-proteobacteria)]|nr:CvpA family protein [Halofilum sp. (in: g-proteobacteria)]
MTILDWAIVVVMLVSGLISIWRGFVKEAISLATWILAFWIALAFGPKLAVLMPAALESPTLRWLASVIALFMATLLVGGLANFLVSTLVEKTGLTGTDRALGTVFGILRGAVLVALAVLLMGETAIQREGWWQDSSLRPYFSPAAEWMKQNYPAEMAESLLAPG